MKAGLYIPLLMGLFVLSGLSCISNPVQFQGAHLGSWKLESINGILPYVHSETILTLKPNGTWQTTYEDRTPDQPIIYGGGQGTYVLEGETIIFTGQTPNGQPVVVEEHISVVGNTLTLIDEDDNMRIYKSENK